MPDTAPPPDDLEAEPLDDFPDELPGDLFDEPLAEAPPLLDEAPPLLAGLGDEPAE
jgi:hypothetical protein